MRVYCNLGTIVLDAHEAPEFDGRQSFREIVLGIADLMLSHTRHVMISIERAIEDEDGDESFADVGTYRNGEFRKAD